MLKLLNIKILNLLYGMLVVKKGMRLSVQPVEKAHFKQVLRLASAVTQVR